MSAPVRVAVIGGGLAGISAALALAEAGAQVTLTEARPRLGGATSSFRRGELTVDTGQHVFLRCCTAYRGLLARLGMTGAVTLQDAFDVTVLAPGGRRARLRRSPLPGPLQFAPALAGYRFLTPGQRLRVGRAALAMAALDVAGPGLDTHRLGDWLAARGQDERTRRLLWDLFTVSALNIGGDDADLGLAATVVKMALLGSAGAADIGVPAVPLGRLHGEAALAALARLGVRVRLSAKAVALSPVPGGGFGVRVSQRAGVPGAGVPGDGVPDVDGVVLAVPPQVAGQLLPAGAAGPGPGPGAWRELATSPIVNVHVRYSQRVTRLPFAAAVDSQVQWVFDRTGPSGLRRGQYLAVSLSAADEYLEMPVAALRQRFLPALAALFPAAREATVTDFFVTRERRATLRQVPGCGRLRPRAATGLPGLVLAGAWTDTGWPDTMEGAVRSGLNAARQLRRELSASAGTWAPARAALPVPGPAGPGTPGVAENATGPAGEMEVPA